MPKLNFCKILCLLFLTVTPTFAQSLADVLSSIQERKILVEQRQQLDEDYEWYYGYDYLFGYGEEAWDDYPDSIDAITPIDWQPITTLYPSENDLLTLGLEDRIKLLNIAIKEIDVIKVHFLNIDKTSLESGSEAPAKLQAYSEIDLPSLGRANHDNYHVILSQVALQLDKLRAIRWPYGAGMGTIDTRDGSSGDLGTITKPTTISATTELEYAFIENYSPYTSYNNVASDVLKVMGQYNVLDLEDPETDQEGYGVFAEGRGVSEIRVRAQSVNGMAAPAGIDLLEGNVTLLSKVEYNPFGATDDANAQLGEDSRYVRIGTLAAAAGQDPTNDVILNPPVQAVTITGTWEDAAVPEGNIDSFEIFVPTDGKVDSARWGPNAPAYSAIGRDTLFMGRRLYYESTSTHSLHYMIYRRVYECVFVPDFNKGIDKGGNTIVQKLKNTSILQFENPKLQIAPDCSTLFRINMGPAEDHGMSYAAIAVRNPKVDRVIFKHQPSWEHYFSLTSWMPFANDSSSVPSQSSSWTDLVFMGAEQDYGVKYETRRTNDYRKALPEWNDGTAEVMWNAPVHGWKTAGHHLSAWDRPRLRQVVGKQMIATIDFADAQKSDYKYTIKIHRVNTDTNLTPDTSGLVDTTGLTLLRSLTVENPDQANGWPGASANSITITDSVTGESWTVQCNDENGDPGHNDWVMEAKKGSETSAKVTHEYAETTLTTKVWTGAGTSAGTVYETTFVNNGDWYKSSSRPSTIAIKSGESILQLTTYEYSTTANYTKFAPQKITVAAANHPDTEMVWKDTGLPHYLQSGDGTTPDWKTNFDMANGDLKITSQHKGSTYATSWIVWPSETQTLIYTAPNGLIANKTDSQCSIQTINRNAANASPFPWSISRVLNSDGTGSIHTYTKNAEDLTLKVESGMIAGTTISKGGETVSVYNDGILSSMSSYAVEGTTKILVGQQTYSDRNSWGAPTKVTDMHDLESSWSYDGAWLRVNSQTDFLGLSVNQMNYDAIGRITGYNWNGANGTRAYSEGGNKIHNNITIAGVNHDSEQTYDGAGDLLNLTTSGGQPTSISLARSAGQVTTHIDNSATDVSLTNVVRQDDGSLHAASGTTLAFGGVTGDALSIVNGLMVTKSAVAGQTGTFAETYTDAWGRTRKMVAPSKSGNDTTQTTFGYSLPNNPLKRIITTEPNGRIIITESDAAGTITRSGIDVNGNGSLGTSDRYTECITTVVNGKVVTTLLVTDEPGSGVNEDGLREVLETKWTPASGITETKINGGEETITTTPSYAAKTVTTESNKGWSKTDSINNLGLATNSTLTGTGIPHAELKPVWRADGSLASVDFDLITGPENQKETHTASFNTNGTLATLTVPGRGNILGGHTISNGVETLTVNGVTHESTLDGTSQSISGANVIGRSEALTTNSGGYKNTTTPAVGAPTDTFFNASLASTGKTYAVDPVTGEGIFGEARQYQNELLSSITLARGGEIVLDYSNDGAKDLASATWPAMASGPLTIPSVGISFGYNRSGNISALSDPSGTRALSYQKGRLVNAIYTAGILKGYEVIPGRDSVGRHNGTLLKRDGATIHATAKAPNGVSDQITNLTSGNLTATPQRDGAGRINGFVWSDGTNSVTQTWARGPGGRIETAGSDVPGAPSFNYLLDPENPEESFDGTGRRLKSTTAGGTWTYVYGAGGQLVSATHPTLGTFAYAFDGIGRRTDKGEANTSDVLNRTTAWTHSQDKTLTIKAHQDARVWFNGVEIENFTGSHSAAITPPGIEGGWVPWETLAMLEGAGEGAGDPPTNPLASPDAKAEKKGAVWVPPIAETLTYDAAGNRESSAKWDFGWDAKNQLARARTKNHSTVPQAYDIIYTYDSEGRRIRKHVVEYLNGTQVSEKIITFVWEGWDLLYERHQLPSGLTLLERKYLWGPDIADGAAGGAGGLLLIRETKGSTTKEIIPLYDGGGNVIAITDINKNLLASYHYGLFGEKISATGPHANSNPWRWATKYLDEETGLYYFGKRYYDPNTGQWMSREILGESESINLYSYCHNDPINKVDVQGLWEINTQEDANSQRVEWLLMQLSAGSGLPTAPLDEWKLYFPEKGDFGLYKPYGPEDYKNAQTFLQNLGRATLRASTWEEAEAARQPSFRSASEWIPSATSALTLGAANTPHNASINSDWLLPSGAGAMGAKFVFGGMKTLLPILAAGVRVESKLLTTEMQVTKGITAAKTTARAESSAIIPYSGQPTPTSWPGNRGFLGAVSDAELSIGTVVDRYGARGGSYVSPAGTPFPMRGLPSTHASLTPETYEVVSPFRVKTGLAAPAFGQPGLGIQHELPFSVQELIDLGLLKPK